MADRGIEIGHPILTTKVWIRPVLNTGRRSPNWRHDKRSLCGWPRLSSESFCPSVLFTDSNQLSASVAKVGGFLKIELLHLQIYMTMHRQKPRQ
jgi:hypothetical protein